MPEAAINGVATIGLRRWQFYSAIGAVLLSTATYIFKAGVVDVELTGRVSRLEHDMVDVHSSYARKDVTEQRLSNIEQALARVEAVDSDLRELLRSELADERRRR